MAALAASVPIGVIGAGAMGAGIAQVAARPGTACSSTTPMPGASRRPRRGSSAALDARRSQGPPQRRPAGRRPSPGSTPCRDPRRAGPGRPGDRGDRRGPRGEARAVRELESRRRRRRDPRDQHLVALDHRARRRAASTRRASSACISSIPRRVHAAGRGGARPRDRTRRSRRDVIATAEAWGKTPVDVRSTPGFIVNRCARPFYGEALRALAERAADAATIDAVMREAGGFPHGPVRADRPDRPRRQPGGQPVRSTAAYFHDPRFTPSVLQQELVAAGLLGRKTGRGSTIMRTGPPRPRRRPPPPAPARSGSWSRAISGSPRPCCRDRKSAGIAIEPALRRGPDPDRPACAWSAPTAAAPPLERRCSTGRSRLSISRSTYAHPASVWRWRPPTRPAPSDLRPAVGLLQAAGIAVSPIDDLAGLLVMRTVACWRTRRPRRSRPGIASAEAIDHGDADRASTTRADRSRGPRRSASSVLRHAR